MARASPLPLLLLLASAAAVNAQFKGCARAW
jgi:hypothetical protein